VPYRAYEGSDGRWLTIGASSNKHFGAVCQILGAPELATDERFDSGTKRRARRAELTAILRELFKRQPAEHWIERIVAAGVPAGPINKIDHVLDEEPHVKARRLVVETEHPTVGRQRALATPIKLSRTEVAVRRPAPRHGQHTAEVLSWAGVSDEEIAALAESGAIRALETPTREAAPVAP
jgi:crotonobetainyl-CoA:carnitine CoA-transferase CaiB-like acyl-CoA transferase